MSAIAPRPIPNPELPPRGPVEAACDTDERRLAGPEHDETIRGETIETLGNILALDALDALIALRGRESDESLQYALDRVIETLVEAEAEAKAARR